MKFWLSIKKRFAKPSSLGQSVFGFSYFGAESAAIKWTQYGFRGYGKRDYGDIYFLSGIYQVRTRYNHKTQTREKYYIPHNPRSIFQQAWRSIFADAIVAWQGLTSEEKRVYNIKSYGKHKSGYNIFLGEYLKAHK